MRLSKTCPVVPAAVAVLLITYIAGCSQPTTKITTCGLTRQNIPQHPFMLFSKADIPTIAQRKDKDPLLADCWTRLSKVAADPDAFSARSDGDARRRHRDRWWSQLEARALIAAVTHDPAMTQRAIVLIQEVLAKVDPHKFYSDSNFHDHGAPLRALALAWDWLYEDMTVQQRGAILPGLENWCGTAFDYTNKQFWREASYNVGAIPMGGIGTLALAIRGDSSNPNTAVWLREATRRIGQNYFPTTFKPSGICYEGPNYSIVGLKYTALFAQALRRAGGDDLLGQSGALRTMQYQMYDWMPQGGCTPIGDNTSYGRRTFAAEYLLGIGRTHDAAGLWTWRKNVNVRWLDHLVTYLWYPLNVKPESPADLDIPPSRYFEVTRNRAGLLLQPDKMAGSRRRLLHLRHPLRTLQPSALRYELIPPGRVRHPLRHPRDALPI